MESSPSLGTFAKAAICSRVPDSSDLLGNFLAATLAPRYQHRIKRLILRPHSSSPLPRQDHVTVLSPPIPFQASRPCRCALAPYPHPQPQTQSRLHENECTPPCMRARIIRQPMGRRTVGHVLGRGIRKGNMHCRPSQHNI